MLMGMYEEMKENDEIDVFSPINLKGKSESVNSASGSFGGSENHGSRR